MSEKIRAGEKIRHAKRERNRHIVKVKMRGRVKRKRVLRGDGTALIILSPIWRQRSIVYPFTLSKR